MVRLTILLVLSLPLLRNSTLYISSNYANLPFSQILHHNLVLAHASTAVILPIKVKSRELNPTATPISPAGITHSCLPTSQ